MHLQDINTHYTILLSLLNNLIGEASESGNAIEVRKIFYEASPAVTRYCDPYAGTGDGSYNMLDSFGWGKIHLLLHL